MSTVAISDNVFAAYLKCPRKACLLRSLTSRESDNEVSEWQKAVERKYQQNCRQHLESVHAADCFSGSPSQHDLKNGKQKYILQPFMATREIESRIHALDRVAVPARNGQAAYVPIRFFAIEKVSRNHKLLLAFDAFALGKVLGEAPAKGKIIHGSQRTVLGVRLDRLIPEVESRIEKLRSLLAAEGPPQPILIGHCSECEFERDCKTRATERDDLSLLDGLATKERAKLNAKGIFTVTQLAYTFRPRRRPKYLASRREKYQHALKALAIREQKIHVVGKPELKIAGTPIFLDVEGIPDRDFYYLIGVRIPDGSSYRQHSFWADTPAEEESIWRLFLDVVQSVDHPVLIHYGAYETACLKRLGARYPETTPDSSFVNTILGRAKNLLTITYSQIYFPTYSNRLKDVAQHLGFRWSHPHASGLHSLMWRQRWEESHDAALKHRLITYNREDCEALEVVTRAVERVALFASGRSAANEDPAQTYVQVEGVQTVSKWRKFTSPIPVLEEINNAAHWDYQRDRVYIRNPDWYKRPKKAQTARKAGELRVNKTVVCSAVSRCPKCHSRKLEEGPERSKVMVDLRIWKTGVKRWVVKYLFHEYECPKCEEQLSSPQRTWGRGKYGWGLVAFLLYEIVGLSIPQRVVTQHANRLFGLTLPRSSVAEQKAMAARRYADTRQELLRRIIAGRLVHVDETPIVTKGKRAYVWVFCNFEEVVYVYSDTREAKTMQDILNGFKGVLVSDFYTAYDSVGCAQQKCLIHLMRDLNDEMLKYPYDDDLRQIVQRFGDLLRLIVATIDRRGLKKHYLRKHLVDVRKFYSWLFNDRWHSEVAGKCAQRFERNRDKLFTFLNHDGVPWNNNNAEHAMKAFASLRDVIEGTTTARGIEEYLVLLSVSETCSYKGVDFLKFLLSGEKDIDALSPPRARRSVRLHGVPQTSDSTAVKQCSRATPLLKPESSATRFGK